MTTRWHDADSVSLYVAGTMAAGDIDAFEEHLLGCAECRLAVRIGAASRVALASAPAGSRRDPAAATIPAGRPGRGAWMLAGALAAAVVVFAVYRQPDVALTDLEAVSPPAFDAAPVRATDEDVRMVDVGMAAYAASDFDRAAEQLGRAAAADSSVGVKFFLGAALLLTNRNAMAIDALRDVIAQDSPYRSEARLLVAKAFLRLGRADSALAVLDRGSGGREGDAALRAFADSIRAVVRLP